MRLDRYSVRGAPQSAAIGGSDVPSISELAVAVVAVAAAAATAVDPLVFLCVAASRLAAARAANAHRYRTVRGYRKVDWHKIAGT
jgi:hypothetical protein